MLKLNSFAPVAQRIEHTRPKREMRVRFPPGVHMFASRKFRKIFAIRFLGFTFIQIGLMSVFLTLEPVLIEEARYQYEKFFNVHHSLPQIVTSASSDSAGNFSEIDVSGNTIKPVSTDFGIVIEKINANAKVMVNVDPADEKSYSKALADGVAHAKGTSFPGEDGNIYLFSHSVDAPWNIVRYNAIFYLLGKLEKGDRVIIFYNGRRFDYIVFDKQVVPPSDTHFLTNVYDEQILTLQTCDPPGTLLNRLVVRARLAGV